MLPDGHFICENCADPNSVIQCREKFEREEERLKIKAWTSRVPISSRKLKNLPLLALAVGTFLFCFWFIHLSRLEAKRDPALYDFFALLCGIVSTTALLFWISAQIWGEAGPAVSLWEGEDDNEHLPTLKQLAFLASLDAPINSGMTSSEASEMIDEHNDNPGDREGKRRYHQYLEEFEERHRDGESIEDIMESLK